jgi:hypothetical protein
MVTAGEEYTSSRTLQEKPRSFTGFEVPASLSALEFSAGLDLISLYLHKSVVLTNTSRIMIAC